MSVQYRYFGNEHAPLLVVDNVLQQYEDIIELASKLRFVANSPYYPGIRAVAPQAYSQFILDNFSSEFLRFFDMPASALKFTMCHYSLVTAPAEKLNLLQRIPHFDSMDKNGLAVVHYLFKKPLGGTAFYRHNQTGYETIDESRKATYFKSLELDMTRFGEPASGYINGDTPIFTRILNIEGVYNRMLVYRRNSLHSGSIGEEFIPDNNPLIGRLSLNSFIDLA